MQLIEENQNISDQEYISKLWSGNLNFLQNEETIKENIESISDFFKKLIFKFQKKFQIKKIPKINLSKLEISKITRQRNYFI